MTPSISGEFQQQGLFGSAASITTPAKPTTCADLPGLSQPQDSDRGFDRGSNIITHKGFTIDPREPREGASILYSFSTPRPPASRIYLVAELGNLFWHSERSSVG
jgi:hypothetical protein